MDKILFIDAHNAIHRACIGFVRQMQHIICDSGKYHNEKHPNELHCACGSPWDNSDNRCYGDKYVFIYNFFRNLRPLIADFEPDKCYFVLEGHPKFRYDLYPEYKANRFIKQAADQTNTAKQSKKEKFNYARNIIIPLLSYLPLTICKAVNYEADDVISSLCDNMMSEDLTILTNDKDYKQLLQRKFSQLRIYDPIKKEFMQAPEYPFVVFQALTGDKSDNIKRLVSDKKALQYCSDTEKLIKFLSLEENRANFSINRQLIEFKSVPEEEIILQEGIRNFDALKQEFTNMRFKSFIEDHTWARYIKSFETIKY